MGHQWGLDMNDVDTSEIEDKILLAVNKYDELKDKILYTISPTSITIYNTELNISLVTTKIEMVKYINEIAIYKRYLTEESIFEDDTIGSKGLIVFTEDYFDKAKYATNISYEKISDNIFVEEVLLKWDIKEDELNTVVEFVKELSKNQKEKLKEETKPNEGVIYQTEYSVSKDDKGYYEISVVSYKAKSSISYFEEQAFRNYIEVKALPRYGAEPNVFWPHLQEDYPEMQISEQEVKFYYISSTGEFLGNTQEEANTYLGIEMRKIV